MVALGLMCLCVLTSKGELVPANLMVNEASDMTLVCEGFARRVGLFRQFQCFSVRGTGGVENRYWSRIVDLYTNRRLLSRACIGNTFNALDICSIIFGFS